ncbi:MAG: hypothetical protein ACRD5R_11570 [Candidatus Acidiferrales bacterium]
MKHAAIGFSSAALLLIVLYGAWVRADKDSRERGEFAAQMSGSFDEHIFFYAAGPLNKQLTIVPEYAEFGPSGQVSCDWIVDDLIQNHQAMSELQQKGFTSLRCGERQVQPWTRF